MRKNIKLRLGLAAGALTAAAVLVAGPALADPPAATYPTLAGTGSDTTQDVVNGLATAVSSIGSWDATGSATIQTRSGGATFNRPNGSSNGIRALTASANGLAWGGVTITGQLDYARSSSGPSGSGTDLTYIPFAKDAVTFAVNSASDFPRDIPLGNASQDSISPAPFTLRNIYRCTVTSYQDANLETVAITPLLPQSGSGTRSFWLGQLGLTEATKGGCVTDQKSGSTVQEHAGSALTGAGDIVPFSIAQYIAQGNHSSLPTNVIERRGQVDLGLINGNKPYVMSTGGGIEMNSGFPVSRSVYNVVQTSRLGESAIASAFVGSSSAVCTNSAIIKAYGFATLPNCGATTLTGPFVNP